MSTATNGWRKTKENIDKKELIYLVVKVELSARV